MNPSIYRFIYYYWLFLAARRSNFPSWHFVDVPHNVLPLYKALYLTFTLTIKASAKELSVLGDVNTWRMGALLESIFLRSSTLKRRGIEWANALMTSAKSTQRKTNSLINIRGTACNSRWILTCNIAFDTNQFSNSYNNYFARYGLQKR